MAIGKRLKGKNRVHIENWTVSRHIGLIQFQIVQMKFYCFGIVLCSFLLQLFTLTIECQCQNYHRCAKKPLNIPQNDSRDEREKVWHTNCELADVIGKRFNVYCNKLSEKLFLMSQRWLTFIDTFWNQYKWIYRNEKNRFIHVIFKIYCNSIVK